MVLSNINKQKEIITLIKLLQIPIEDVNYMNGERQVELRYKGNSIGYLLCENEHGKITYQTSDDLTLRNIKWGFVYDKNKETIDALIAKALEKTPVRIWFGTFRTVFVRPEASTSASKSFQCQFNGTEWSVTEI